MVKLFIGLLKGAVIGGAIGYGAYALKLTGGMHWLTYGLIGALVGFVVGRPIWSLITDKNATSIVSILKALVGFGIGCGMYAIVAKAWGGFQLSLGSQTRWIYDWQPIMGAAVGALWGGFIELDDAVGGDKPAGKKSTKSLTASRK